MNLDRAGLEVVLVARAFGAGESDGVAISSPAPQAPFVMAGELVGPVVEALFVGGPCCRVECPTLEGRVTLQRAVGDCAEHRRVACNLHLDSAVGKIERVAGMEHVTGIDLAPPNCIGAAAER